MKQIGSIKDNKWAYWLILALICGLFFAQALFLAHQQPSKVDEGSFLTKGYLFITGRYRPFEDYGPWTNNMPLAYLIPGIPQAIFGPGLMVGRYFVVLVTFTTLAGLWIILRRLIGKWWALAAVFALSINPAWIGLNGLAVSQPLVACLVTWILVFLLGDDRKLWQICAAALLSAAVTLTRQNMVFMIPFVVFYTWWQYGFRKAVWAFLFAFIPVAAVHAVYFPKIMTLWYTWLPRSIKAAFSVGTIDGGGVQVWKPSGDLIDRISSFSIALRYHFISLIGVCFAVPMIFKKKNWRSDKEWKSMISLLMLFVILFGLHAWASLFKNYCIYCFPNYVAFFIPIGTVIAFLAFSRLVENKFSMPIWYISGLYKICIPVLFFGSIQTVGRWLLQLPFPRIKNGRLIGGVTQVWELLRNRFQMTYDQLVLIVPPIFGLLSAVALLILLILVFRLAKKKNKLKLGYFLALGLLVFAVVFTPTVLIGKASSENTCGGDVISAYELAGSQLQQKIPDDASVFWGSGSVVTPLLYIADAGIQPLQLNGIYPKRDGGDRDLLEKYGYYNADSQRDWRDSADFILVQSFNMGDFWKNYLTPDLFDEYEPTIPIDPCDPNSGIQIFRRND